MTRDTERLPLGAARPGTERFLLVHRYGAPGGRPKAYLQAALHADETPALLVLHHLTRLLDGAAARGGISGRIVLVPYANPIGLDQIVNRVQSGRYALAGGGNFNRDWPDLYAAIAEEVEGRLTDDAVENVALIRRTFLYALAEQSAVTELSRLRLALAREAADADTRRVVRCNGVWQPRRPTINS